MDHRVEAREFLTSRRAKLAPGDVGLPGAGRRRVPGLRRSEVAALAGVSVEYYARIERTGFAGVSPAILHAIARALRLDAAERAHMLHLAEASDGTSVLLRPRRSPSRPWSPRPSLQWVLDTMHSSLYERTAAGVPNFARYTFLDDDSHTFYPDWHTAADICVAILRTEAGRDPHDRQLQDLVGELSTLSDEFRRRWSSHEVRLHGAGTKIFHHGVVGDLDLAYESVDMISDPGLTLTIYAAEPASRTAEALSLLASWTAAPVVAAPETPTR
jgi:transcriptional regulator with XRE-family HTH domain